MRHLALERSLTDRTYDAILDAICDGELAPGARITQDELAAEAECLAPAGRCRRWRC